MISKAKGIKQPKIQSAWFVVVFVLVQSECQLFFFVLFYEAMLLYYIQFFRTSSLNSYYHESNRVIELHI